MSENTKKALMVFIQSVITALLLFVQSTVLGGCVSAGGDVNQTNDVKITVPSFHDALKSLREETDSLTLKLSDFEALDDELVQFRQDLARQFYENGLAIGDDRAVE